MGELSGIKPPQMEWNDSDLPTAFKSFKQYCQLIFDGPLNMKEDKVKETYMLLWIGEEGRKIFNSFDLNDEEIYICIYTSNCARSLVLWFQHCGMTELYHMRWTLEVVL